MSRASERQPVRLRVLDARPEPPVRGERVWAWLERPFLALERLLRIALPERLDPFAQTGAVANTAFLIACASGVLLLFWYVPSVHEAYGSVQHMSDHPWTAELVRSIHRYSSDGCVFFVAVHALRYLTGRRFGGARWLAWVTGLAALGLLWMVGWLGYWLVWDERAHGIALGTARMLDVLPIFAEPMSRSFLTDGSINSLLFFVVFFVHMLVPLGMGIVLWLHITRLSRPNFLANAPLTLWMVASLVVLSLAWPATSAGPAHMLHPPHPGHMDFWFLLPVVLTDRLGGGALWAVVMVAGTALMGIPWWLPKGRAETASVDASRCNACKQCVADCPYGAIRMVPRTDTRRFEAQAEVIPSRCVGCGICAGACNSAGIGLPSLSVLDVRKNMDRFVDRSVALAEPPYIAFLCNDSAAAGLSIDPATGRCDALPGYVCWAVPCAGWVHSLTVERAVAHGAAGVLIVACGEGTCTFREGGDLTEERMAGLRDPALRSERVDGERVRVLRLDRGRSASLKAEAAAFRRKTAKPKRRPTRARQLAVGLLVAVATTGATALASDLPYAAPPVGGPELVVSFKHPGQAGQHCHVLTAAEKAKLPVYMRRDEVCERRRASVRLKVKVDGRTVLDRAYAPSGLFGDGDSLAIEHLHVSPGPHRIDVAVGDTADVHEWTYHDSHELTFRSASRHVVLFDRVQGFTWD